MARHVCRTGIIVSQNTGSVEIEFDAVGTCSACQAGYGCGIGPVVRLFRSPPRCRLRLDERQAMDLRPGVAVRVGIGARTLLIHVALVYLLPLLGLVLGALGAGVVAGGSRDASAVAGAAIGLVLSHLLARFLRSALRLDAGLQAEILDATR